MRKVICLYFIYFSLAEVVRAASRAKKLLQLSHLPNRGSLSNSHQVISMNMESRALDHLLLTERQRNPSVKSGIRPTSRVMMVRLMDRPPSWQLVDKPVKYLTPSQKSKRSQGICWMRGKGSQFTIREVEEEAMIWTIPCWMERFCPDKNPSPSRNQVSRWMDNISPVSSRHRLMDWAISLKWSTWMHTRDKMDQNCLTLFKRPGLLQSGPQMSTKIFLHATSSSMAST